MIIIHATYAQAEPSFSVPNSSSLRREQARDLRCGRPLGVGGGDLLGMQDGTALLPVKLRVPGLPAGPGGVGAVGGESQIADAGRLAGRGVQLDSEILAARLAVAVEGNPPGGQPVLPGRNADAERDAAPLV